MPANIQTLGPALDAIAQALPSGRRKALSDKVLELCADPANHDSEIARWRMCSFTSRAGTPSHTRLAHTRWLDLRVDCEMKDGHSFRIVFERRREFGEAFAHPDVQLFDELEEVMNVIGSSGSAGCAESLAFVHAHTEWRPHLLQDDCVLRRTPPIPQSLHVQPIVQDVGIW